MLLFIIVSIIMKDIILDFDGVIADTFELHRKKVGEFTGNYFSKNEFRDLHNGNIFKNKNNNLKNVNWDEYQKYISYDLINSKLFDDFKKNLGEFRKNRIFIISSGSSRNILFFLKNNKIDDFFVDILGLEFSKSKILKFKYLFKKYKIKKSNCFFVTDTLGDLLEANSVGVKTIAVNFGFNDEKTLKNGRPLSVVSSFKDFFNLISKY